MQLFRNVRLLMLALLVSLTAVSIHAQIGIAINVGFAPPVLPVYVQPICPQPNLMWTPGYWAYSNGDGYYYLVPGAWVPAPFGGALWTPPYWGFSGGQYGFHGGYWGQHVGYYGGVNYGFGFGGIGFAGGEWRGNSFAYNTAVVHVNETFIHTTYVNRTIVEAGIVANPRHVSYNGGPGGIQHEATPAERVAEHEQHTAPTAVQSQHETAAKADKSSFAKANGGHPANVVAKPAVAQKAAPAAEKKAETKPVAKAAPKAEVEPHAKPAAHAAPAVAKTPARPAEKAAPKAAVEPHATPKTHPAPAVAKTENRPAEKAAPKAASASRTLSLRPMSPLHPPELKHGRR